MLRVGLGGGALFVVFVPAAAGGAAAAQEAAQAPAAPTGPGETAAKEKPGWFVGDFLVQYAPAAPLPYLPDVARLEWAIDEAHRAAEAPRVPEAMLAALASVEAERLASLRLRLDPSCRLVTSPYPILHVWRANQPDRDGRERVLLDEGADRLLVRRDDARVAIEPLQAGEHAWLAALAASEPLGAAIEAAQFVDALFDLGGALHAHIGAGTLVGVVRA